MPSLVVPFRGVKGKSRLEPLSEGTRDLIAGAMLADVLAACSAVGATYLVGEIDALVIAPPEVAFIADPGGGQGAAVRSGLHAAALARGGGGPLLVVNADLPCVTPRDLLALAGAIPEGGIALAPALDGTTNALGVAAPELFEPVYGPGSAARFADLAPARLVEAPNLVDDVDTLDDLERLHDRLGRHTLGALEALRAGALG